MILTRGAAFLMTAVATFLATVQPTAATGKINGSQADHRPLALVEQMKDSPLKERLLRCADAPIRKTLFSIGHRGAPLGFPEHTLEGYRAAAEMGAGIVECDVTFTSDKELVCRHALAGLLRGCRPQPWRRHVRLCQAR